MNFIDRLLRRVDFYSGLTNFPYLSGDTFSSLCDLTINSLPLNKFDRSELKRAKSVFIKSELLFDFVKLLPPLTDLKVVVVGNGDTNFGELVIPSGLGIQFYCQNYSGSNSGSIKLLPLGLENLKLAGSGQEKYFRPSGSAHIFDKVLVPPHGNTNEARGEAIRNLYGKNLFVVMEGRLSRKAYFRETQRYKFVLCLEGNGFDTHRIWETLYQNNFPVVLKTAWSKNLECLGLPILIVDNFDLLDSDILQNHALKNLHYSTKETGILWGPHWQSLFAELENGN
jgi:hypothetical protein